MQQTTQSVEMDQPKSQEEASAFGDWDIRREQNTRPKVDESSLEQVDKKNLTHSTVKNQITMMTN